MALGWGPQTGDTLGELICQAIGINPDQVRRVIVDCEAENLIMVYVEMYGGKALLDIDWAKGLKGAQVQVLEASG